MKVDNVIGENSVESHGMNAGGVSGARARVENGRNDDEQQRNEMVNQSEKETQINDIDMERSGNNSIENMDIVNIDENKNEIDVKVLKENGNFIDTHGKENQNHVNGQKRDQLIKFEKYMVEKDMDECKVARHSSQCEAKKMIKIIDEVLNEWINNKLIEGITSNGNEKVNEVITDDERMSEQVSEPRFTGKKGRTQRIISVFLHIRTEKHTKELVDGSNGILKNEGEKIYKKHTRSEHVMKQATCIVLTSNLLICKSAKTYWQKKLKQIEVSLK